MDITCSMCGNPMTKPGALLFGPPQAGLVRKFHVCDEGAEPTCFQSLLVMFKEERITEVPPPVHPSMGSGQYKVTPSKE